MYLPFPAPAAAIFNREINISLEDSNGARPTGGWSSLIGVITAICGNILISFALNTQRYAHLRLSRGREERQQEKRRRARQKRLSDENYGTQQEAVAEDRARQNAKSEPEDHGLERPEYDGERQPLIPRLSNGRTVSGSSDMTARTDAENEEDEKEKSYLKSPIWWLGISLMVLGEAGNFLAYGFAPASIVSPLGVVALISNCLIAPLLLGEKFRWRDGLGVLIAVGGCVVVVLSASESNPKLDPDVIWDLITRWEFETYFGITAFLIILLIAASNRIGDKSILIDLGLVGLFGGYTALATKGIASLLSNKIWRVITFPITYLLVFVLVLTAIMQIKYVNRSLQRFNATMVIPTQFVLFTLSVIVGSAILYRDFEREQTDDAVKFVAGCALTFFGVWCITSGRGKAANEDNETDQDGISLIDEEAISSGNAPEEDSTGNRRFTGASAGSSGKQPEMRANGLDVSSSALVGRSGAIQPRMQGDLAELPPGPASLVHLESAASLGTDSNQDLKKPPALHATTSAPVVPTTPALQSNTLRPKTPLLRNPSSPATQSPYRLSPISRNAASSNPQFLDPSSSQRLLNRPSVVGLLPGPLTSPLSNSLSAIVADELRRGVDSNGSVRRKSMRRGLSRQDLFSKPIFPTAQKRHSIASGDMDLESSEAIADLRAAGDSPSQGKRMRSLSATLGDLFKKRRSSVRAEDALGEGDEGNAQ